MNGGSTNRSRGWGVARGLLSLAMIAVPLPLLAAGTDELETMVVTGSRLATTTGAIPSHVTVIDREMLEATQARSVLDVLRSAAGVNVTQYGGRGGVSSVYLRGAEPNFTAVFIDGVRVNDPTNSRGGSFDFSTLNLAEIERIEIARGTQSSVYGADALAGVIGIFTRQPGDGNRLAVDGEIGEDDFYRGSLHLGGELGSRTSLSLTGSVESESDWIDGNEFENRTVSGRLRSRPSEDWSLGLSLRYADTTSESFPEDSGGPDYAVLRAADDRDQAQLTLAGRARWEATERFTLGLEAGYLDHDEEYLSPGIAPGALSGVPPYASDSSLERTNLALTATVGAREGTRMLFGVDYQDEDGRQAGSIELAPGFSLPTDFALDRDILGAFAEVGLQAGNGVSASASIRRDDPSDDRARTTVRIGAQYASATTRIFASYGEGYKLPSFFALGHPLVGNPDLEPETSTTWEVGISQAAFAGAFEATLSAFVSEYKDLIDFDFELFTNVNRARVDIDGVELAADLFPIEGLTLSAHVTHLDVDVHGSPTPLRQRPDWSGGISGRWEVNGRIAVSASWQSVGSFYDSAVPTGGVTLDGYDRLDLETSWRVRDWLTLWLAVDNAFAADYEETVGFPALGTRARIGFRYLR